MTAAAAAKVLYNAGFRGLALLKIVAIAAAESGYNEHATNTAGNSAGTDVGLCQINTYYHPEYEYSKLFDPDYNAAAAYTISKGGTDFSPWVTYKQGIYKKYTDTAQKALAGIGIKTTNPVTAMLFALVAAYIVYRLIK